MISPESITRAGRRYTWVTVAMWSVALLAAGGMSGAVLAGALTTDVRFAGDPPSLPAEQMGVGPAVAVLIVAAIARLVVVPAPTMLPGDRNWYLPGWLRWVLELQVEGAGPSATAGPSPMSPRLPVGAPGQGADVTIDEGGEMRGGVKP